MCLCIHPFWSKSDLEHVVDPGVVVVVVSSVEQFGESFMRTGQSGLIVQHVETLVWTLVG